MHESSEGSSNSGAQITTEAVQINDTGGNSSKNNDVRPVAHKEVYPDGGWEAWTCIAASTIVYAVGFGFQNAFGSFQAHYTQEMDPPLASPFRVSWIGSAQVWFTFASALITGAALDRTSAWVLTSIGTILFVLSCMLMSIATSYWSMFLAQGLLQGVAVGILFPPALTCPAHWFSNRHRGLTLGIVASGSSLGGVVWPIVLDRLIHEDRGGIGFPWALRISGFIALGALIPTIPFVRKRLASVQRGPFVDMRSFQNRAFVLLLSGQFIIYLGLYSEYYYLPQMAATLAMPSHLIFYLSSAGNGASAIGRWVAGWLADRYFGRFNVLIVSLIGSGIVVFSIIAVLPLRGSATTGALFAITSTYGFVTGAFFALTAAAVAYVCDEPQRLGTWIGQLYAVISIPALFGPPITSQLIQRYGFTAAWSWSGAVIFTGTVFVILSRFTVERRIFKAV
ncbi:unnamed protein product [Tilletia controversa]|uniref:Major facilitator superfamily (MFS) profile domain-containing protein n=1 Tax=Tilletia controversa TaxID=13291 RepID=A0A8X7MWL8_9BASI|nr:hypothetical protein CF328_g1850 [Tilletia controversa]KAE8252244.1 hypothetical protein A4X06_0g2324 [Tilletia controversa]CAD6923701.1 unnamed protein product [Tilletia controversa]